MINVRVLQKHIFQYQAEKYEVWPVHIWNKIIHPNVVKLL